MLHDPTMDSAPYNREEIESLGDAKPTRGVQCPKCNCHIPEFAELDAETTGETQTHACWARDARTPTLNRLLPNMGENLVSTP